MTTQLRATSPRPVLPWVPNWLRNAWGIAAAAITAYVLLYIAWTYFHWGGEEWFGTISDLGYLPISLFAAAAAARVAADRSLDWPLRRAWLVLALCILSQFLADALWAYQELALRLPIEELSPGPADILYLAFYPLCLAGLLLLPGIPPRRHEALKLALDLAIVMVSTWIAVWYFIIAPAAAAGGSDLLGQLLVGAYPTGDLVVLAGVATLLLRGVPGAQRSALLIFLLGLLVFVAGDLVYARDQMLGLYYSGAPVDGTWALAYVLFGYAALRQAYPGPAASAPSPAGAALRRLSEFLPFAAIAGGYGMVLYAQVGGQGDAPTAQGTLVGAALLTLAVVGRQMVTLRENAALNRELRAFSNELELRVEERTLELRTAQQELFAAQKLASAGTLAAGVVHEVTNPLNTILAASEALAARMQDGRATPETLNLYLPMITRAGQQAARILEALRTYARGSAPELAREHLAAVVQDTLLLMGYQLRQWEGVQFITEFDPDLPEVWCDRNQIAQVLINLLNNARDAMPTGGRLILRTRHAAGSAVVEVVDTGVGIAPEIAEKIFDPFFTTKPLGRGMGLGLAIATGIVRAHNGTLTAHSAGPGRGATFVLTLPTAPPQPVAGPPPGDAAAPISKGA